MLLTWGVHIIFTELKIKNHHVQFFFSFEFIRSLGTLLGITPKDILIVSFSVNINRY